MSEIKKLMGDSISEETAVALQTILDNALQEKQEKIDEITAELKESKAEASALESDISDLKEEHRKQVQFMTEKADEFAEQIKEELTEELQEKFAAREEFLIEQAEAYGEHLISQGEAYGAHLIEKAEAYGEHLTERAEAYGEHLMSEGEAYGAHLIERAEAYGESVKQECLVESEVAIKEFKDAHLEEFARLDEHNRMTAVFNNLKTLIESSGFSIDESSQVDSLQEEIRNANSKVRSLNRKLRDNDAELKKFRVAELIEKANPNLTFKDKERVISTALKTRCETPEELSEVVSTLVENTVLNKGNTANRYSLNENLGDDLTPTQNKNSSRRIV